MDPKDPVELPPEQSDPLYLKAEVERTEKGIVAVASSAVEDRHGEIVSVEGWDLKNFKKNPVLLWAHDHTIPAIGVAKNIKVDGEGKKARLIFEPTFQDVTPEGKAIKTLFEDGILNSFSVGFRALEMEDNVYTKQELLEISAVNVPANPEARTLAYKSLQKAGFDKDAIEKLDILTTDEVKPDHDDESEVDDKDEVIQNLLERVEIQEKQIEDLVKGLQHLNPRGRSTEVVTTRLSLNKVIVRAADKILESQPKSNAALYAKVIKRASEKLIVDHKQELKG